MVNTPLSALRRLASEAVDNGLLDPELAAGRDKRALLNAPADWDRAAATRRCWSAADCAGRNWPRPNVEPDPTPRLAPGAARPDAEGKSLRTVPVTPRKVVTDERLESANISKTLCSGL